MHPNLNNCFNGLATKHTQHTAAYTPQSPFCIGF